MSEKWFFELDSPRETCYYICINEERLENESGVLQHPQSDSFGTTIENWNSLRFTGTLNTSVDGESFTLADIDGVNTNLNHKTNFAFPTEVTKSA